MFERRTARREYVQLYKRTFLRCKIWVPTQAPPAAAAAAAAAASAARTGGSDAVPHEEVVVTWVAQLSGADSRELDALEVCIPYPSLPNPELRRRKPQKHLCWPR